MDRKVLQPAVLTFLWGFSLVPFFRWWGVTLRAPGLTLWTLVYIVLYAATAYAVFGKAMRTRHREVRNPLGVWTAFAVVSFLMHLVFPQVSIAGQPVQTSAFINILEFAIPCWIIIHAVLLLWQRIVARILVLTLGPTAVFAALVVYMIAMPGASFTDTLPPLTQAEEVSMARLEATVWTLASEIGERNDGTLDRLRVAADYVDSSFMSLGYEVSRQPYEYGGRTFENIEGAIRGRDRPDEIVVVGGHYDSVEGTPGADDNASGTAAVLELARLLRDEQLGRTVRFVAFVNEEPPFFSTKWMGSWQYAARAAEQDDNIVAMISLETVGFYQEGEGSQGYPPPFNLFYPDVGNFIGFVGNLPSRALVRRSIATFRRTTRFPSQGVAAPEQIPGVWWSDHAPFWIHGFKAIMITDTAPFRNPHYHQSTDTPDRLNYEKMARVVAGVAEVVRDLANN